VLVVSVFGWTGGKQRVTESYADAREELAQQKAERAAKRAERKAERAESGGGPFRRRRTDVDAGSASTEATARGEPDD
jgi:hypothetical protein